MRFGQSRLISGLEYTSHYKVLLYHGLLLGLVKSLTPHSVQAPGVDLWLVDDTSILGWYIYNIFQLL